MSPLAVNILLVLLISGSVFSLVMGTILNVKVAKKIKMGRLSAIEKNAKIMAKLTFNIEAEYLNRTIFLHNNFDGPKLDRLVYVNTKVIKSFYFSDTIGCS